MSLINDALKRANQAQKQKAPERPDRSKLTPLQPVENPRPGFDWSRLLLPVILGIVLMAAGAFLWSWSTSHHSANPTPTVTQPRVESSRPTLPEPAKPTPEKSSQSVVSTAGAKPPIKINTNVVVRPPPAVPTPVEAAAPVTQPNSIPVVAANSSVVTSPPKAQEALAPANPPESATQ